MKIVTLVYYWKFTQLLLLTDNKRWSSLWTNTYLWYSVLIDILKVPSHTILFVCRLNWSNFENIEIIKKPLDLFWVYTSYSVTMTVIFFFFHTNWEISFANLSYFFVVVIIKLLEQHLKLDFAPERINVCLRSVRYSKLR